MRTWKEIIQDNPEHSQNYANRWKNMRERGDDINGEARLVDALVPRQARILDAGCGTGRLGGYLCQQGHKVTGIDIDPYLIEIARTDYPEGSWHVGDISVPGYHAEDEADLIVCAGNVLTFIPPAQILTTLENFRDSLAPRGRCAIGFGAGRGLAFPQFFEMVSAAGLAVDAKFSTWSLYPFDARESDFLVVLLSRPNAAS